MTVLIPISRLIEPKDQLPARRTTLTADGRQVKCCGKILEPTFWHLDGEIREGWWCSCGKSHVECFPMAYVGSDFDHRAVQGNRIIARRDGSARKFIAGGKG